MYPLTQEDIRSLMAQQEGPCVSLYMPTRRAGPDTRENHIRFKTLLKEAEASLEETGMRQHDVDEFLKPARALVDDRPFWRHQGAGFAAFVAPDRFERYTLPLEFETLSVVTNHFHVKPLLPMLSGDGTFYVLAMSAKDVRLLHGSHYTVDQVRLPDDTPKSLAESEGMEGLEEESETQFHTTLSADVEHRSGYHGQGVGTDDQQYRLKTFCRRVDKGVQKVLRTETAPLVFAGVESLFPLYRDVSGYNNLMDKFVHGNPDRLSEQELHDKAWPLVEPKFSAARHEAKVQYRRFKGSDRASSELEEVIQAATNSRVAILFVALQTHVWGTHDEQTGEVTVHEERQADDEDLLDLAAEQTVAHGGIVYAVPAQEVPDEDSALAAVYRF
jgi:hypothetical protein